MNQAPPVSADQQRLNAMMAIATLQRRVKSGANNFYWIAALSVINSFVYIFGGGITFVVGLGLTQIVDGLASGVAGGVPGAAALIRAVGIVINVGIAGVFAFFGFMAGRNRRWAFLVGMLLYALDTVLVLVFKDYLGFLFHLFFLFLLFGGLSALGKLRKVLPPTVTDPGFPKDIGS
jgi:hypothetical protein